MRFCENDVVLKQDDAESLIVFIKNHEREDIPDSIWDICMDMWEQLYEE